MDFHFSHNNINVLNLEKSIEFYEKAFSLTVKRIREAQDGSFKLAFLTDGKTPHALELTWLAQREQPYNLGENEFHLCFEIEDYAAAHALHKEMGCICFENESMGVYFVADPDGYWVEIIPSR